MRALNWVVTRLLDFTNRRRRDARRREKSVSHPAIQTDDTTRAGKSPGESLPFVEELLLDVRYAFRVLRKSPAFTFVALVTLMLSIGANIVTFAVLNAVLLQPTSDVRDPQGLYQVRIGPRMSGGMLTTSYPDFEDFRRRNTTFVAMAAKYGYSSARLSWDNAARMVRGYEVTGGYFELLGAIPQFGRFFGEADERGPGSAPYVVLSDALWRSAFNADRSLIGTVVHLNGHPFTVVGVTSAGFHGTERFEWPDYWIPMVNAGQLRGSDHLHDRTRRRVMVLGRLNPGVTPQQATENLNAIAGQLAKEHPETDKDVSVRLIRPGLFGDDGEAIGGFLYGVTVMGLLLLVAACANLASLFAARAADRSRELSLRAALGASRLRLVRQLLTEAVVVSLIGGAAGLACANMLLDVLNGWNPAFGYGGQRLAISVEADARVYLAGLALSLGSALLFGMVPAWQARRSHPLQMMKSGTSMPTHLRRFGLRDVMLGAQIAICTLLITASLVALRSMVRIMHGELGFKPEGVMLAELNLGELGRERDAVLELEKAMVEATLNIPGVSAAGAVRHTPLSGGLRGIPIHEPGTTDLTPNREVLATRVYPMSPGYLEAAGTRLLGGRDVSWQDTLDTPHVAIVNETFARKMWGETPPIGQRFVVFRHLTEVVGVAEDGKYHDLMESPQPAVYLPLSQSQAGSVVFVVRSRLAPNEIEAALQRTLSAIAPNVPIELRSWPDALASVLFPGRAATAVLGLMGLLAAMLAVTGIFGMAAYGVSRRSKELGIRMALGARTAQVMHAAVGRSMVLLGTGAAVGLFAGIFASRLLGRIVHEANPGHPSVLVGAVLVMALIGIAGSAIPMRRALAIDPSRLMREE